MLWRPLLLNIQTNEQYPNWNVPNFFITVFLFSGHMYGILANEFLLMHWVFDLLFHKGNLCDFQKRVLKFLFSNMMALSLPASFTGFFTEAIYVIFRRELWSSCFQIWWHYHFRGHLLRKVNKICHYWLKTKFRKVLDQISCLLTQ